MVCFSVSPCACVNAVRSHNVAVRLTLIRGKPPESSSAFRPAEKPTEGVEMCVAVLFLNTIVFHLLITKAFYVVSVRERDR